MSLLVTKLMLK